MPAPRASPNRDQARRQQGPVGAESSSTARVYAHVVPKKRIERPRTIAEVLPYEPGERDSAERSERPGAPGLGVRSAVPPTGESWVAAAGA